MKYSVPLSINQTTCFEALATLINKLNMSVEGTTGFALIGTHAVLDVLVVLLVWQYHRRRKYQPIRSRFYWQGEAIVLLLIIPMFLAASSTEFEPLISCDVYLLVVLTMFNAVVPIIIRAAHVFSAYEVSKVYARQGSSNGEAESFANGNIFLRRAEILQSFRFQVAVFIVLCLFHTLVWVIYTQGFESTCNGIDELIGVAIFGTFYCGVTFYLGWNIATLKDGLYIRRELILVSLGGLLLVPTFVALRLSFETYYYANLAIAFGPYWLAVVQIGMPLYKSYQWQRLRQGSSDKEAASYDLTLTSAKSSNKLEGTYSSSLDTMTATKRNTPADLKRILQNESGYDAFLEFSRLELNHENVLFYNEATPLVVRAKQEPDFVNSAEYHQAAKRLYDKYISSSAKLELNVSASQRRGCAEAGLSSGPEEVEIDGNAANLALQEVWKEVFYLMFRDILPRFLLSKQYLQLKDETV